MSTNLLILNPKFGVKKAPGGESLDVDLHLDSYRLAMDLVEQIRESLGRIFILADTPLYIKRYPQLFIDNQSRRKKRGAFGLRHLGQFCNDITDPYVDHLADGVKLDDILVITESRCNQALRDIASTVDRLPACTMSRSREFSCSAITAIGTKLAVPNVDETGRLIVTMQKDKERTPGDIILEGLLFAKETWLPEVDIDLRRTGGGGKAFLI